MKQSKGAEAIVTTSKFIGRKVVVKDRVVKNYRNKELDEKLRRERTRREARLLHKAKLAGVSCPTVLAVEEFKLTLEFVKGKRKIDGGIAKQAGEILAKLHNADIIHGDFTPANLLFENGKLVVIDFGLGFVSSDIEDKAIDVLTMLKMINTEEGEKFVEGYRKCNKFDQIEKRIEQVKKRARYA
ncbi:MAG: KEOPS complex kinase/ATPase Bud32 [Candidatus Micrarchaeota archaeon]